MFKHYLKTAVRSLVRKKLYTSINIFGLAIGLAMCLTVMGHITNELSFDNFHTNKDNIYRAELDYKFEDEGYSSARVMAPLGDALVAEIPEVKNAAVFRVEDIRSIGVGDERFKIVNEYESQGYAHGKKLIFAKPDYLEVFTFPLLKGDARNALTEPFSVLITERAVAEYFPDSNPIGSVIEINDRFECHITGILKDIPQNTQLFCDFIVSYSTLSRIGEETESWTQADNDYAYLLLEDNASPADVEGKIPAVIRNHMPSEDADRYSFRMLHLPDIFFGVYGSGNRGELYPAGEASVIYAIALVALFILLQAIANFINLSTARSADRTKEVGVRKVLGADRRSLMKQFLGESMIIAFVAMILSLLLYEIFKESVQTSMPRQWFADFYDNPLMLLSIVALIVISGVFAGFYPALYLSRFRPIAVLQARMSVKSSRSILRKILVVFQFGVAIVFVFCTLIIIRQTNMLTSTDPGFDYENILLLEFDGDNARKDCALMRNEIRLRNKVVSATVTNSPPGMRSYTNYGFYPNENRLRSEMIVTKMFRADHDFISTFGLQIVDGTGFSDNASATGTRREMIISESTAKTLKRDNPVGTLVYSGGDKFYEIVGVVKDFHGSALAFNYKSELTIIYDPDECATVAVKLPSDNIAASIASIGETWANALPGYQFDYSFLDQEISANYDESRSQGKMFFGIAAFAILIACLGIFGLVSYTAEQRTREIGIRKVLGATVASIVKLLSKEFVILIVIANALALPIGYMMMTDFLRWHPIRVGMGVGSFALVAFTALFFALATASFQSIKAALANPVDSVRRE